MPFRPGCWTAGGPLPIESDVEGTLDVARRQDLAQQHAGEHIVSGLLHKRFGYENVGFHVGAELMEVDFSGPLTDADIAWVEAEANRVVRENQKIRCWYPSEAELPGISYRTKRALPWPVRMVELGDVDRCACCGVHVGSTGEIGLIKIVSCVKFKGGSRLEMCCGGRAYRYCAEIFEQNRKISRLLSAKHRETAEGGHGGRKIPGQRSAAAAFPNSGGAIRRAGPGPVPHGGPFRWGRAASLPGGAKGKRRPGGGVFGAGKYLEFLPDGGRGPGTEMGRKAAKRPECPLRRPG